MPFTDLVADSKFTRRVGHDSKSFDMPMTVTEILGDHLLANPDDPKFGSGYLFHRESGQEVDEDMNWGPNYGRTGSIILPGSTHNPEPSPPAAQTAAAPPPELAMTPAS